ncbi:hypothetical protein PR048_026464 [Dryococelus australis]|uniref:Uncharacterized protein n=1 Tax=Dryococelus australis TaxID=614101 RepID=A0ABQ9GLE7_9NEOP|nr:hypothetical protein PR048_026464 [Dryococelus australis]
MFGSNSPIQQNSRGHTIHNHKNCNIKLLRLANSLTDVKTLRRQCTVIQKDKETGSVLGEVNHRPSACEEIYRYIEYIGACATRPPSPAPPLSGGSTHTEVDERASQSRARRLATPPVSEERERESERESATPGVRAVGRASSDRSPGPRAAPVPATQTRFPRRREFNAMSVAGDLGRPERAVHAG